MTSLNELKERIEQFGLGGIPVIPLVTGGRRPVNELALYWTNHHIICSWKQGPLRYIFNSLGGGEGLKLFQAYFDGPIHLINMSPVQRAPGATTCVSNTLIFAKKKRQGWHTGQIISYLDHYQVNIKCVRK